MQVRKLVPAHLRRGGGRSSVGPVHVTCAMFNVDGEIAATYNDEVRRIEKAKPK